MYTGVISKSVCQTLSDLTQEPRLEVALPLGIKDWVRLKLEETNEQREVFEHRYGMEFHVFEQTWTKVFVENDLACQTERDYREWEVVVTNEELLRQISESLL